MPLAKPAAVSNIVMIFMATWNDYLGPVIFVNDAKKQTVQVAIAMLNSYHETQTDIPVIMAAALIALLPVLILFTVCQNILWNPWRFRASRGEEKPCCKLTIKTPLRKTATLQTPLRCAGTAGTTFTAPTRTCAAGVRPILCTGGRRGR